MGVLQSQRVDDVTAFKRAATERALETLLLDRLAAAVVVTDLEGIVVYWNRRAEDLYGYSGAEAVGTSLAALAVGPAGELAEVIGRAVVADGRWEGEYDAQCRGGSVPVVSMVETVDLAGVGFHGVVNASFDNTERRRLQSTLADQALHDSLTGLPNRELFLDRVERALARTRSYAGKVAVLLVDLDRFKLVNDSCGQVVGDEILRTVGELLGAVIKPEDTVARLGGDQFAVCCESLAGPEDAMTIAEQLTAAVSHPFLINHREFYVTPSIGIAMADGSGSETAVTLLRDADSAKCYAKERGRARYELFDGGMYASIVRRAEITSDLRRAVDRDELLLHFLPLVRLSDGRLEGFEALLRWKHPERGLLGPIDFMDVAEETNLMVSIGAWALADAARQLAAWREELPEHPLDMTVNLSARQFADPGLLDIVRAAVVDNDLDPSSLCLEINESVLMANAEASTVTLRSLKAIGVRLAIDDFGTGYSSLAYLKRFPVDFLKIDRSFVDGLGRDPENTVIVQAIIELARALGLSVVAEGVETDEQLAELHRFGCEYAQGYWWSPPRLASDALELAEGWGPTAIGTSPGQAGSDPGRSP